MARTRRQALALAMALPLVPVAHTALTRTALAKGPAPEVGEDGMHIQPWFHQSFLDLREDLAEAASSGRGLVVFWEQRGCPYCREMHAVNLVDPEIVGYLKTHFVALQLNLYGSREVTDFDGTKLEERRLAQRWRVNFTPTLCFFPQTVAATKGKSGRDAEAWRLMGYWKPFHFLGTLVYVQEGGYASEPNFQRWLSGYADKLRAQGKDVKMW